MNLNELVFYTIAVVTLLAALGVVGFKNIVHSALALVLTFLGVAALYFQLGAGFLGLVQVLVYAGAVSVLIVFAVMLVMDREAEESNLANPRTRLIGGFIALLLTGGLGTAIWSSKWPAVTAQPLKDSIGKLAQMLLGDYVVAFEAAALLLLLAVVGAIILVKGAEE